MAEREKRVHFRIDFLDYQNISPNDPEERDMLQFFKLGMKTGAILSFHNIAPLLQKRTFGNQSLCERIKSELKHAF